MEKLLIRGGRVIDPANGMDKVADVLIADGKIAAVGENLTDAEAKVYDAAGKVVAPGKDGYRIGIRGGQSAACRDPARTGRPNYADAGGN